MRRIYNIESDNCIFDAPLVSDYKENVYSVTGINNSNNPYFSADGLHVLVQSQGQFGVKFTMPQAFMDRCKLIDNKLLMTICWTVKKVRNINNGFVIRADNGQYDYTADKVCWCQSDWNRVPLNTVCKCIEELTLDYSGTNVIRRWSQTLEYNGTTTTFSGTQNNSRSVWGILPSECPYLRVFPVFYWGGRTDVGATEAFVKDIQIFLQ